MHRFVIGLGCPASLRHWPVTGMYVVVLLCVVLLKQGFGGDFSGDIQVPDPRLAVGLVSWPLYLGVGWKRAKRQTTATL
jgi:hypothetical protein